MQNLAPIILFTFNRPDHTRKTLEALALNNLALDSTLFIYSDAPKNIKDQKLVGEVRRLLPLFNHRFKKVHLVLAQKNKGLVSSILEGVTDICNQYGKAVILEDDIVTSPYFLEYMNLCLERYESTPEIMSISGYTHTTEIDCAEDAVMLPFISSWGWGTWKRAWDLNNESDAPLMKIRGDKELIHKFNLNGTYPYYEMLEKKNRGLIKSWAISWYANVFFNNGLSIFPKFSLVKNIGFDGSGENCKIRSIHQAPLFNAFRVQSLPKDIKISQHFDLIVQSFPKPKLSLISIYTKLLSYLSF